MNERAGGKQDLAVKQLERVEQPKLDGWLEQRVIN